MSASQPVLGTGCVEESRIVRWIDSCYLEGQGDESEFPKPSILTSVGFVVRETDDHIVLARDNCGHDGEYRGLIAIPKIAILGA